MKKDNHSIGIIAAVFVITVIAVAWYYLFGYALVEKKANKGIETVDAEEQLLDIAGIDDAYDAILNKSTKEFIGNHAIDESFLSWFMGQYGVEMLESIAAYAALDDGEIWYQTTGESIHVLWYYYCKDMGIQQYNFEKTYEKTGETPYEVVMDFTGDFSLAEGVGTTSYYNSVEGDLTQCLSAPLLQELQCADVLVVNNEFVYSTGGVPVEGKDYHFRADPSTVSALLTMGCDVAGVANNHVYDYGEQGLLDTLSTLEDNGIPYIGAGQNLQEASEPVYFIINGRKIAFVAATQIERSTRYTKEATDSSPGVLKTLNPQKFVQAISLAKQNADYVICYVHWGTEDSVLYEEGQEELARSFIQAGADAIIGGHTHCLQGIDVIDGVPVFYSLGNFYFSQEAAMPEDYDTGVAQLILSADGSLEARFLPCYFSEGQLSLLEEGEQYQKILEQMRRLSGACTLDDRGYVITE